MQTCDTLLKGTVISMDPQRRVFIDGYVAIGAGKILAAGRARDCDYQAKETIGGPDHLILPGLVNVRAHLVQGCILGGGGRVRRSDALRQRRAGAGAGHHRRRPGTHDG